MKFPCPNCGQRLEAENEMSGVKIACPSCAAQITIPDHRGTTPTPLLDDRNRHHARSPDALAEKSDKADSSPPAAGAPTRMVEHPADDMLASSSGGEQPGGFWSRKPAWAFAAALSVLLLAVGGWFLAGGKILGAKTGSRKPGLLAFFKHAELADLKVFPAEVNLKTKQARQSLVVQAIYADGATRDVTSDAS